MGSGFWFHLPQILVSFSACPVFEGPRLGESRFGDSPPTPDWRPGSIPAWARASSARAPTRGAAEKAQSVLGTWTGYLFEMIPRLWLRISQFET